MTEDKNIAVVNENTPNVIRKTNGKKLHPCPVCGRETENKYCSKECYYDSLRKVSHTVTEKLGMLDNTNRCWQCGKEMPIDRYSAYCEECEMQVVYETGQATDLTEEKENNKNIA